jgi:hypothetical protein
MFSKSTKTATSGDDSIRCLIRIRGEPEAGADNVIETGALKVSRGGSGYLAVFSSRSSTAKGAAALPRSR